VEEIWAEEVGVENDRRLKFIPAIDIEEDMWREDKHFEVSSFGRKRSPHNISTQTPEV
jgi:hypothetical protein